MLAAGLLTCSMFYAAVAPRESFLANFGQSIDGAAAEIVVRNWGALIGLMGVLLIYGAFSEKARFIAICVAGASKVVFIALILWIGRPFLRFDVLTAVILDVVVVMLFVTYLVAEWVSSRRAA